MAMRGTKKELAELVESAITWFESIDPPKATILKERLAVLTEKDGGCCAICGGQTITFNCRCGNDIDNSDEY